MVVTDSTMPISPSSFPVTKSALSYDADKEVYLKTLYGSAQKDALTGEQLSFANIVIQRTYHETRDDNGNEVTFNTGRTMIFVVQLKGKSFSKFKVNGVEYAD